MSLIRAEIDLTAIAHNTTLLRKRIAPNTKLMAVVKADAYGHGDIRVAQVALSHGADCLGVARITEGKQLRNAGISAPILVFGYIPRQCLKDLIAYDLTATVYSFETAAILSDLAVRTGHFIRIHIKVDTGMGRLGLLPDQLRCNTTDVVTCQSIVSEIEDIAALPKLVIEGIYTHFATSDFCNNGFATCQLDLFLAVISAICPKKLSHLIKHAANSSALLNLPASHLDMVRPGIALYGLRPLIDDKVEIDLRPAMSLKTSIIHIKQVPTDFPVSYGRIYQSPRPTTIATVAVGYADGFSRHLSDIGCMLVHGQRAPVVGRVCMDLTMLDVGHIPDVAMGDEVVVFGKQRGAAIQVDELADTLDTINYEIVTSISERVPRVYLS